MGVPLGRVLAGIGRRPLYPFLLATLPAVHFYETNFRLLEPGDIVRPVLLGWIVVALVLAAARIAWRDAGTAALVATPVLVVVFEGADVGGALSVAFLVAAVALGVLLARRPAAWPARLAPALNGALAVLAVLPPVNVALAGRHIEAPVPTAFFEGDIPLPAAADPAALPDIYFLLVDGLGQPSFLERNFPLAREDYSAPLERRGFTVLRHGTCNYPQTALSAAATLNLAPLDSLLHIPDPESRDRRVLRELVGNPRAVRALQGLGYAVVSYPSGYPLTRLARPDERRHPLLDPTFTEYYILEDGFLPLLLPLLGRGPADVSYALRRGRLDFIFDDLPRAREGLPGGKPAFVFAHILAPHPPFVYGRRGEALPSRAPFGFADGDHWLNLHGPDDRSYRRRYADQAAWVMRRLGEAVDGIVRSGDRPRIIIVQGDHGPGSGLAWEQPLRTDHDERFGIFNAWYVSGTAPVPVYEGMSAMNTFPLVFNAVFGADIAPLPDDHWFARMSQPYIFFPVGR